ncbi:MAG: NAD(+) diphosphatase [Ancrocorticia sp.]|uniref:NAD(+) diphosphatase n=1 Tax=Ancrocorticia sp. TaxID=2593684 RepID=UPI003F9146CE
MLHDLNLARGSIDRDELTRNNPSALAKARNSPDALFILVAGADVAIDPESPGRLLFLTREQASGWGSRTAVYLGKDGGHPYFACDATGLVSEHDVQAADHPTMRPLRYWAHEWEDLDTALAVGAVAVLQWRHRAKFCTECGAELSVSPSGWEMVCTNGHLRFPRTDPAVIMAIHDHDDRLLLGRNSAWGPGKYSVLAGFVEAGESLEAAVRREVYEEAHIAVGEVRYFGSQPWPFPRSLMLAFDGWTEARPADIAVDGKEMADARFFSREELTDALRSQQIQLPSPTSVAASLIQTWLGATFADVLDGSGTASVFG